MNRKKQRNRLLKYCILLLIEKGLKDDVTADSLADAFSVSSVHLQRLFKAAFNQTIGSYIRSLKLLDLLRKPVPV